MDILTLSLIIVDYLDEIRMRYYLRYAMQLTMRPRLIIIELVE